MNFTDSPFERMMKQPPKYPRSTPLPVPPPKNTVCTSCSFWNGVACVGVCYRELVMTSGQHGPKSE